MSSFSKILFDSVPLIGILRGVEPSKLEPILTACIEGGLTNLEITLNSPGALTQIESATKLTNGNLNIGAGTVLSLSDLQSALNAGASFIVTPTLQPDVIQFCVQNKVPVFPGAFTPTEIARAWDLGATMVKIFPAETLGPSYIKAIKAPFPSIKLLPTGGVDLATMQNFLKAGADGFGIGSPLFNPDRITASDWTWLTNQTRAFVDAYKIHAKGLE